MLNVVQMRMKNGSSLDVWEWTGGQVKLRILCWRKVTLLLRDSFLTQFRIMCEDDLAFMLSETIRI